MTEQTTRPTAEEIATDELARGLYAAHLVVTGFSEVTAEQVSRRRCPEDYYELATDLRREFPAFRHEENSDA